VLICGRTPEHLGDALNRIRDVGQGDSINVDLAEPAELGLFSGCQSKTGLTGIVVVNAAVPARSLSKMTAEEVRYAIAVDFTAYLMSAHAAQEILADKGDIVLIGSMSAHVFSPGSTVYAGMKARIAGFSEALRRELGPSQWKPRVTSQWQSTAWGDEVRATLLQATARLLREVAIRSEIPDS